MDGAFRYVPAHELAGRPHVIADGAARPATVLTLSHWPRTPTPPPLWRDLSAEIALAAAEHPELLPPHVDIASLDHYDVDGVVTLALLCDEELRARHGELLVEVARVGDFGVVASRRAALVSFALGAMADPLRTPIAELRPPLRPRDALEVCAAAAAASLALLPALADDPSAFEELWKQDAAEYEFTRSAIEDGSVSIEEDEDLDLAVIRVPPGSSSAGVPALSSVPSRAALHSATERLRIAVLSESHCRFYYRYETWVRLASRRPRLRVDLAAAVSELEAEELAAAGGRRPGTGTAGDHGLLARPPGPGLGGGGLWSFDGAGAINAGLGWSGAEPSRVPPDRFLEVVRRHLAAGDRSAPAWDPYAG